jgi:hypothetical protein
VVNRSNLKRKGWDFILNQAWDYSMNADAIAAGASRPTSPYQTSQMITDDYKALLLAFDDL